MANQWKEKLEKSDLEQLLREEVISYEANSLTAAGDNYGSIMLAVDVTLKSGKQLNLVAKLFPDSEQTRIVFQSPLSMRKEIDMYLQVSPEFKKIQEEHRVPISQRFNIFCACPGARLTLEGYHPDQLADENSVLLLENLKFQGYRVTDRVVGQDLKHAELVMNRLAKFHATGLAIKLQKPLVFKNKILKACEAFKIKLSTKEVDAEQAKLFLESVKNIPICGQNIDSISNHVQIYEDYVHSEVFRTPKEPFATMVHDDLWTNNMMFKYKSETDKDPLDYKFYDFQVVRYGSPVSDVIFFLFTSTETGIVTQYLDHLLNLYHNTFVDWLKLLGCETDMFGFTDFLDEVNLFAPYEITHILYWLMPITLLKEQVVEEISEPPSGQKPVLNEVYVQKASDTVKVFVEKSWL